MKPEILVAMPKQSGVAEEADYTKLEQEYDVTYAANAAEIDAVVASEGARFRAVVTTGGIGLSRSQIDAMPNLKFIQTRGMGLEKFDLAAAAERGIVLANSRSVNFFAVAEHAMALLLALVRQVPGDDSGIRAGKYEERRAVPPRHLIYGKTMGVLGLGDIGSAIAQRALGFEASVIYHNRSKRPDVPYEHVGSVGELARRSDILIVSCPGGPATKGLVDASVLEALGPSGFLVNVGRGSVVDVDALVEALNSRKIAGAAVDVIEGEPNLSEAVLKAPNLIITPHIAGGSPESRMAGLRHVTNNLRAHFSGGEVKHRVI